MRTDSRDSPACEGHSHDTERDAESRSEPSSTARDGAVAPGAVICGRYQVQSLLGRGGMGVIYRARDLALGREVAIKVVRDAGSAALRSRFLREAQLAARVQHPHTVYVVDFGPLPQGDCFLAMELLEGRTLAAALSECGSMPPLRVCRIGAMIASGMQSIHAQGIVHRDIKPSNIFLLDTEGTPDFVKIVDFGVARELKPAASPEATLSGIETPEPSGAATPSTESSLAQTSPGALVGTPRYMAPEQLRGESLDPRADQYALGCILYELLTGEPPFQGSVQQMTRGHLYGELVPPRRKRPQAGISAELEAVILRAMARRRQDRFADMQALGTALQKEAAQRPRWSTSRVSATAQLAAWTAAGLTLVAAGLGVGGWAIRGHSKGAQSEPRKAVSEAVERSEKLPEKPTAGLQDKARLVDQPEPKVLAMESPTANERHAAPLSVAPTPLRRVGPDTMTGAEPSPGTLDSRGAVSALIARAADSLAHRDLFDAKRLLDSARASCLRRGRAASDADGCASAALQVALYLGRVHEAEGNWAEALSEYARVLEGAERPGGRPQVLAWRAEAEDATVRLMPRVGRLILTRLRAGRCEEVPILLPPGEHQLEIDGRTQVVSLRARETQHLGSCSTP